MTMLPDHSHPNRRLGFSFAPFLACLLVLLSVACRTPSRPGFVIGLYGVDTIADLDAAKASAFDVVVGPANKAFLDAAHSRDIRVFALLGTDPGPQFNKQTASKLVSALDRHPALFAWYLVDEPDLNLIHPAWVMEARRTMKRLGARAPLGVVFQNGGELADYRESGDFLLVDRYPVAWQPLSMFEQHVKLARVGAAGKPLYAILQAFDWAAFPSLLPGEKNLRAPTAQELRCMTYGALAQRAEGLFYYAYRARNWNIRDQPELWEALTNVVAEVRARQPLFEAEHLWWPWRYSLVYLQEDRLNELQESRITLAWLNVSSGNSTVPSGDYILAVNSTPREAQFRLMPPVVSSARIPVVGSTETKLVVEGWFRDTLEGYGTRVYGPIRGPHSFQGKR